MQNESAMFNNKIICTPEISLNRYYPSDKYRSVTLAYGANGVKLDLLNEKVKISKGMRNGATLSWKELDNLAKTFKK